MRFTLFSCLLLLSHFVIADEKPELLLRIDDAGMSHSVNQAIHDVIKTGIPVSVSVMVPTPWFNEAVEILKDKKNVAIGLHLTLTSEFKEYRWRPVAGRKEVSSLIDQQGYFYSSVRGFLLSDYRLTDIETEIRAQMEVARKAGLKISYLDHHMGIARATPEIASIIEKVAKDYGVAISRYYGEVPFNLFHYKAKDKVPAFLEILNTLPTGQLNMFVMHPGRNTPELRGMLDMNSTAMRDPTTGKSTMFEHRAAELAGLTHQQFIELGSKIRFVNYHDIIQRHGLAGQIRGGILYTSKKDSIKKASTMPVITPNKASQ